MKKRCLFLLVVVFAVVFFSSTIPSSATAQTMGNGYETFSCTYAGRYYNVTLTVNYNPLYGGRTRIMSSYPATLYLDAPRVEYSTINYGDTTNIGAPKIVSNSYSLDSDYVPCRYGMHQVINYNYITGTGGLILGGTQYSGSVFGTPA